MTSQAKKRAVAIGASVVVLGGVGAGLWAIIGSGTPAPDADIKDVVAFVGSDKFNQLPADQKNAYIERMWGNRQELDWRDEETRRAMRAAMEARLDERMNAYFDAAPGKERNKVLDEQIAEFQKRMAEMRANRPQGERPPRPEGAQRPEGDRPQGDRPQRDPSRARERADSRDATKAAMRAEYFMALRKRAEERGIELPGRGFGGFGGGPGGGGRGDR